MWLTVKGGPDSGKSAQVTGSRFTIGRDEGCSFVLKDEEVSRTHAALAVNEDGTALLEDLGSSNGTRINGELVHAPALVKSGDTIRVGATELSVAVRQPADRTVVRGASPPAASAARPSPEKSRRVPVAALAAGTVVAVAAVALGIGFATGALGGDDDPSISDVVAESRPSVVKVNASTADGLKGTGSGWVLDAAQGLIVTNNHVVNAGSLYTVSVRDSDTAAEDGAEDLPLEERSATVVGAAPCEDLAVLKTDPTGLRTLPLSEPGSLEQGDQVVALGFPGTESKRLDYVQTSGTVSDVRTSFSNDQLRFDVPDLTDLILTDTPFNPGNSGGPLVDRKGRLVGVVTGSSPRTQAQNYAIGISKVRTIVGELRRGVSIGWTGLGLDFSPALSGAIVTNVVPGTPAASANIDPPLLLTAINGKDLKGTLADYCVAVKDLPSGASIETELTPLRRSDPSDPDSLEVRPGASPQKVVIALK